MYMYIHIRNMYINLSMCLRHDPAPGQFCEEALRSRDAMSVKGPFDYPAGFA